MNIDIKFRIWNVDLQEMEYWGFLELCRDSSQMMGEMACGNEKQFYNTFKVMRESGVFDKNNNHIFEGDILEVDGEKISHNPSEQIFFGEVIFYNGCFCVKNHDEIRFTSCEIYVLSELFYKNSLEVICENKLKIVGNIYENINFLEENKRK